MLSPVCATFKIAKVEAVCPDETVKQARPPSKAATLFSKTSFVGFIISLCLACVIGFQAPLITHLSLKSGAVDRPTMVAYRRHIWFITFVLGAAFSPPDPLSLFLVSLPIILLFEAALLWDKITGESTDASA